MTVDTYLRVLIVRSVSLISEFSLNISEESVSNSAAISFLRFPANIPRDGSSSFRAVFCSSLSLIAFSKSASAGFFAFYAVRPDTVFVKIYLSV